jgi:hypothetical protein
MEERREKDVEMLESSIFVIGVFIIFFAFWVICITLHNNVHFGRKILVCENLDDCKKKHPC